MYIVRTLQYLVVLPSIQVYHALLCEIQYHDPQSEIAGTSLFDTFLPSKRNTEEGTNLSCVIRR